MQKWPQQDTSAPNWTSDASTFSYFLSFSSQTQSFGGPFTCQVFQCHFCQGHCCCMSVYAGKCTKLPIHTASGEASEHGILLPYTSIPRKRVLQPSSSALYFWCCFSSLCLEQWSFKSPIFFLNLSFRGRKKYSNRQETWGTRLMVKLSFFFLSLLTVPD